MSIPGPALLLVFSRALPGQEAEVEEWYVNEHMPDILCHPDLVAAGRYEVLFDSRDAGGMLTVFEVAGREPAEVVPELRQYTVRRPEMAAGLDRATVVFVAAKEIFRLEAGQPPADDIPQGLLLAFNQGVPGKEAEYESWYRETHIPEILQRPGFPVGSRMTVTLDSSGKLPPQFGMYAVVDPRPFAVTLRERGRSATSTADPATARHMVLARTAQACA